MFDKTTLSQIEKEDPQLAARWRRVQRAEAAIIESHEAAAAMREVAHLLAPWLGDQRPRGGPHDFLDAWPFHHAQAVQNYRKAVKSLARLGADTSYCRKYWP